MAGKEVPLKGSRAEETQVKTRPSEKPSFLPSECEHEGECNHLPD